MKSAMNGRTDKVTAVSQEHSQDADRSRPGFEIGQPPQGVLRLLHQLRSWQGALGGIVALAVVLAICLMVARRPFCDEAWFASTAYNLLHHGRMGMTVLDPHGFVFAPLVKDIDKYTFWVLPGYVLVQAAWYAIAGFSLLSMRTISLGFGVVALIAWFEIVRKLTRNRAVALLAVLLLGTEEHFTLAAAIGRMDMMCAALSLAGIAVYLHLRERNFRAALAASSVILAASVFTHPNGIMGVLTVVGMVLWRDRHHLSVANIALAAMPFFVCAALWGRYVLSAPDAFVSQMTAQAAIPHRFSLSLNPFASVSYEIQERYFPRYGFLTRSPLALMRIVLVIYGASIIAALAIPRLRRRPGVKPILLMLALNFGLLTCLQKNYYYLIYVLPIYAGIVALTLWWLWENTLFARRVPKWAIIGIVLLIPALNISVSVTRFVHNDYSGRFIPAIEFLRQNMLPGDLVVGSGELAFGLGFDGAVVDDARLGFTSGKRPDFIVIEAFYGLMWMQWFKVYEPETYSYSRELLEHEYALILDQAQDDYRTYGTMDSPYRIYRRILTSEKE
jgi:4-amino-4-deoxy-L-arabinose transferase-like glycosyltransferase